MSDAPEEIEYVVIPIEQDVGEIELTDESGEPSTVTVTMADLGVGMTAVMAPSDLDPAQAQRLLNVLKRHERERNGETRFILLKDRPGDGSQQWDFVRLVRKDRWDETFREERPGPSAT